MMAIDMHSHWYSRGLVDALQLRTRLPYVRPGEDGRHYIQYAGTKAPVWPGYTDIGARMETMAAHGVDRHLVSLGNRMLNALLSAGAEEAAPLCRIFNDDASAACQAHPGRLFALAMLPYENIPAAVQEFERAIELPGIIGASFPGNGFLDSGRAQRFLPLLDAAQRRGGAHFMVHHAYLFEEFANLPAPPPDNAGPRQSSLETQSSLSSIAVTLNMTDILDAFPDITVQIHNLGGNLPMEISRMDHMFLFRGTGDSLPSTRFTRTLVDCNSMGAQAIELGVALYGAERIMFGTDGSDFGADWSNRAIADARIEDWEKDAILEGTAARLLARHDGESPQRRVAG